MTRQEALELVKQHIKEESLLNHVLATEAIMRALARRLGQDEEKWGLVGLLHDIDYEEVNQDPARHGMVGADMLEAMGNLADKPLSATQVIYISLTGKEVRNIEGFYNNNSGASNNRN